MNTEIKEAKKRGRQKGQTIERPFIIDENLLPFKIKINERSYDVFEGDSIIPIGYYTTLPNALKCVALEKAKRTKKEFSLQQYIDAFSKEVEKIKELIPQI